MALFLIASLSLSYASEMMITPLSPIQGDTISFTYSPDQRYASLESQPHLVIQAWDGQPGQPKAYSIEMDEIEGGLYIADFLPTDDERFIDSKVIFPDYPAYTDDTNDGRLWGTIISGSTGQPAENANYYKGLSLMGSSQNAGKLPDLRDAMDAFVEEQKFHPKNLLNEIALKSIMLDLRKISMDKFKEEMGAFAKSAKPNLNDENTVRAFSRLYKMLGMNKEATDIEKKFVLTNPKSELAQEFLLDQLAKASSKEEFTTISDQYLKEFGYNEKAYAVFTALNSVYVNKGDYSQLIEKLKSYEATPKKVWAELANSMITDKQFMPADSMQARIDSAEVILQNTTTGYGTLKELLRKPRNISSAEFKRLQNTDDNSVNLAKADFYYTTGQDSLARILYTDVHQAMTDETPAPLWQQLALTNLKLQDTLQALDYATQAIAARKATEKTIEIYKIARLAQGVDADFLDREIDQISEENKSDRSLIMQYHDISRESPSAIFSTPEGMYVDTDDWNGKTVVISFVSSWCSPCEDILEALNALDGQYADEENTLFYAVLSWEQGEDSEKDAQRISKELGLSYPIIIDQTDIIPQKFNVTGLPTTFVMDPEGNIRFRFDGVEAAGQSVAKISAALEFLKKDEPIGSEESGG